VRSSPHWISACAGLAAWLLVANSVRSQSDLPPAATYRADALAPVPARPPEQIQILLPPGEAPWPTSLRMDFEQRIRREWPPARIYGPVHSSLGLWLRDPLVTAQVGGRVLVPVLDAAELALSGALELPQEGAARRVVVLVDASASANVLTPFVREDGAAERIPVLEAERRALDHLVELLEERWLEVGVIAFGESTWPVAEPGLPLAELRARLARFRAERPRGEGRTDAVCALFSARDWLAATPDGVEREIIVMTDGELPHSGRFAECVGPSAQRVPEAAKACNERRNRSPCPARLPLAEAAGGSDLLQLAGFARSARDELRVTPLVFDHERAAGVWEQLAIRTGSRLVRVPSPRAVEAVLPALVSKRVRGVRARNATLGETTRDLLEADGRSFTGTLPLQRGANDVELRIEGDRGLAGLFRFRVYSEPGYLAAQLARLRDENAQLASRVRRLDGERPEGRLDIEVPAAAAP